MLAPPPKNSYSRKTRQKPRGHGRLALWSALGIVICLAVAIVHFATRTEDVETEEAPRRARKQIKEHPADLRKASVPAPVEPEEEAVATPAPEIPVGNVMTARTAKVGRVMTLMDGTVITNKVERPFKRDLEHSLWVALRPGNMGAGLLTTLQNRHSEQEIIAMLKEMTVPEEGDSEGMIRIKAEVQELKERILLALDSGRTLSDVFNEIRNQGVMESKLKAETMRMRAEAIRSGDAEQVRETVRKTNELREKNGLEPLSVPEEFQLPEEETPARQTYMEFDEEE